MTSWSQTSRNVTAFQPLELRAIAKAMSADTTTGSTNRASNRWKRCFRPERSTILLGLQDRLSLVMVMVVV